MGELGGCPHGNTYVDHNYSKAYLRHLIISKEILGKQIASIHNLGFFIKLMREARKRIKNILSDIIFNKSYTCVRYSFSLFISV